MMRCFVLQCILHFVTILLICILFRLLLDITTAFLFQIMSSHACGLQVAGTLSARVSELEADDDDDGDDPAVIAAAAAAAAAAADSRTRKHDKDRDVGARGGERDRWVLV